MYTGNTRPGGDNPPDDIQFLSGMFPGWDIRGHWTVAGTGPDARYLRARRGEVVLTAWSAFELAARLRAAELSHGEVTTCPHGLSSPPRSSPRWGRLSPAPDLPAAGNGDRP